MQMNKRKTIVSWIPHLVFMATGIFLDQLTKYYAVVYLKGKDAIVLIPGALELRYLENRGAAFGMMQGGKVLFLIITPIVLLLVFYALAKMPSGGKYGILNVLLDCVVVGAIGNMADRIRLDYVVDFIYISLIDFPIFNVADMFVSISCVVGAILILFGGRYKDEDFACLVLGKRQGQTDGQEDQDA